MNGATSPPPIRLRAVHRKKLYLYCHVFQSVFPLQTSLPNPVFLKYRYQNNFECVCVFTVTYRHSTEGHTYTDTELLCLYSHLVRTKNFMSIFLLSDTWTNQLVLKAVIKLMRYWHVLVRVIYWLAVHDVTTPLHIHSPIGYWSNVQLIRSRVLKPHSFVVFKHTNKNTSVHLPFCSFLYNFHVSRIRWSQTAIC